MPQLGGWKAVFDVWPKEMARRGVLVASFGEQIAFASFSAGEHFLLLERQTPDAVGARNIMLPYDKIMALKITDVVKPKQFQAFGFDMSLHPKEG
jgi:hypothetical protein